MQPHSSSFFNARLLVAEDNPVNQDIAARFLEQMGCRIVTAENGAVAERLLAQEKFDLVLMDCEMPELDGFEVTRRLRQSERGSAEPGTRVPVVALTAHNADDVRDKCIAAGMDDLLAKPLKKAQISETLRRWIGELERPARPEESGDFAEPGPSLAERTAPDDAPIDRTVLDDFLDSKGDAGILLLRRLLVRFSEMAPPVVVALREKYRTRECEDVRRLAHGLRSSAAALGVRHISRRLADIEKAAQEHSLDSLPAMLSLLEEDLAAALEGLQNLVGELNARAR